MAKATTRRGISARAFGTQSFHGNATSQTNQVYKDSGQRSLGQCETHKGIHAKREDCEDFELASIKDVAEDTWRRING